MAEDQPGGQEDTEPTGPFIQVAAFCERILTERDGVHSAIRIVDRILRGITSTEAPDELPETKWNGSYLLSFKPGSARGRHRIRLEMESPDGLRHTLVEQDLLFEGEDRGANIAARMEMTFKHEGLNWLRVYVDGRLFTKSPLRVVYQRQQLPASPPGPSGPSPPGAPGSPEGK